MDTTNDYFGWWHTTLDSTLPVWRSWSSVSQYQKDIWCNYRDAIWGQYERILQLAPNTLSQTINPWSFSLFQFTSQIKGNPAIEQKILTNVAGYGSQLGTILDFLHVLEKTWEADAKKPRDSEDLLKVEKFQKLVADIERAKASAGST